MRFIMEIVIAVIIKLIEKLAESKNIGWIEKPSFKTPFLDLTKKFRSLLFYKDDFFQVLIRNLQYGILGCYLGIQNLKALSKRL